MGIAYNGATLLGKAKQNQVSFDNVANAFTGSSLAIDGGTLMVDSVGNRVGIGTPAPAATLHVVRGASNESADNDSSLVLESAGPNYLSILSGNLGEGGVLFGDPFNPYAKNGMVFNSPTNFMGLDFRVYGGQTAMSIDYFARVGIGTTTPSAKLDVNGTVRATSLEIPATTRNLSIPATATFHSTDASFARTYSAIFSASPAGQNVALYAPVHLPDGAIVTAFRVECLDNDPAHDLYVNLYQTAGDNATYMAQVNTSGASSGTQTMLDSTINLAWIDNAQYGYVIGAFWQTPATFGTIKLFRFVVTYTVTSPLP